ncbi:hypothetical protein GSF24_32935, partial [Microbispora triticiradicis]|nr:hypothetical protein [Microbispora triticiradicis]
MDLFGADPERLSRSNDTGADDWWEQLTARSPLWSTEDALAREYVPIADPAARKHASRFGDSAESPGPARPFTTCAGGTSGAEFTHDENARGVSPDGFSPNGIGSAGGGDPGGASDGAAGAGRSDAGSDRDAGGAGGASSWVAVAAVGEAARAVALVPVPESAQVCLAEA